jgi:methyltransferase (TIGR00027 family)
LVTPTWSIGGHAMISKTAVYVAAARAIGAREPDPSVRNPDVTAEALLDDPSTLDVDHPVVQALRLTYDEAMKNAEVAMIVRSMLVRTRFIDDALARAVADGVTQIAILGAGFDSHAYRCAPLLAGTRVFEVDRPAMQAFKRQRVEEALGGPPPNLTYVPLDFRDEGLAEVLPRHGYDPGRRTFFIVEGVTMYVPEDGVRETLRFIASHPPGSSVVFDFVYQPMVDFLTKADWSGVPSPAHASFNRFRKLLENEPWLFGFPVGSERQVLAELGLEIRETLMIGGEESMRRYGTKADGTQIGAQAIAESMARIAQAAKEAGASAPPLPPMSLEKMREQQRTMGYQLADAVVPARQAS